jgi:hypothetical protein
MSSSALSELLEARKSVNSRGDVARLAGEYGIDVERLESVARFVSSPGLEGEMVHGSDEERVVTVSTSLPFFLMANRSFIRRYGLNLE